MTGATDIPKPLKSRRKLFFFPMKFVPQSDQRFLGFPLKKKNRQNAIRNMSVHLSFISSRWTALVVMQVNIITCASFSVFRPSDTCRVPNMWMDVLLKAVNPAATRSLGIWPINCSIGFFRSFLQVTHFPISCFAMLRSPTIQNRSFDS